MGSPTEDSCVENKERQATRPGREKKKDISKVQHSFFFFLSLGLRGERSLHFPSPGARDFGLFARSRINLHRYGLGLCFPVGPTKKDYYIY